MNLVQFLTFAFLCTVWGTTWVAIKISLEGLPPFGGAALRFTIALALLFLYARLNKISLKMNRKNFVVVAFSAFLMYPIDYGLIYWGEQYLSAGVTAIFFATFPLFTGIWATFLFRNEKFHWNKFIGLTLAIVGIAIVFLDQLLITQFERTVMMGTLAIILGAAGGSMSVVIIKKYLTGVNSVSLSFHQMLQGVIYLMFFSLVAENYSDFHPNLRVILAVIYLGLFGSAIAFALYYWLLQKVSAITLSLIIYITPIVAIVVDYFMFDQVIEFRAIIGMLIIFSGIAFVEMNIRRMNQYLRKLRANSLNR
ncbi:MAG: EamA family transporter [Calditrichota bacterium]|jgi:drug/metabolite transporter (DMT)-like permease